MTAVVTLRDLRKRFGKAEILRGIDLSIAPAEFVVLLGRSGSGKTTLLRLLAGMERPDGGVLKVPGASAVVFQEARLMPWMRAGENVALGLEGTNHRARAAAALAEVRLGQCIDAWPSTLSGGEVQRVALARALVREPGFLLLDEPFAALDAVTRAQMQRLIKALHDRHRPAMLLVTHDIDEALLLADRVVILQEGRIGDSFVLDLPHPRSKDDAALAEGRRRIELALDAQGEEIASPAAVTVPSAPADHRRRDVLVAGAALTGLGVAGMTRGFWEGASIQGGKGSGPELRVGRYRQGAPDSAFFKQAGVAEISYGLRYVDIPSSNELLELISSGAIDMGISANIPPIFTGLHHGAVRQIAAVTTDPAQVALLARPNSGIREVAQIRGRRIGYLAANSQHYFLLKLLARDGLGWDDIVPVALSASDAQAAFERGDLDGWAAAGWVAWDARHKGAITLATGQDLIRLDLVVLANGEALSNPARRAAAKDYLSRINMVWRWSARFPQAWARESARLTGLPEAFYRDLKHPQFTLEPPSGTAIAAQQDIADTFYASGVLPQRVAVAPFWDRSILTWQTPRGAL